MQSFKPLDARQAKITRSTMSLLWRQWRCVNFFVFFRRCSVVPDSHAAGITHPGTHFRQSSSSGNRITLISGPAPKNQFAHDHRPRRIKILQGGRLHRVHDYATLTEPTGMYDCPFGQPQNQSLPAASYRIFQPGRDGENRYSGDQPLPLRRGSCRSRRCMQLMRRRSPGRAAG